MKKYLLLGTVLALTLSAQAAHAAPVPPCKASPVTLFSAERGVYATKTKERADALQERATAYQKQAETAAAEYKSNGEKYLTAANATAAKYESDGRAFLTRQNETAAQYRTAGAAHQAKTVATHQKYMADGCKLDGYDAPVDE